MSTTTSGDHCEEFTAKDFRTWSGTMLCASLADFAPFDSAILRRRNTSRSQECLGAFGQYARHSPEQP